MQKITPFLWFDNNAEEATKFYVSLFPNSKILTTMPGPNNTVIGTAFELDGREFKTLNGGPQYKLNEAFSMFVTCESQEEVDHFWDALIADGGHESQCGWLKDKFGVSWQIIPKQLSALLGDPDPAKAGRAMQAMLQMHKISIADIETAINAG